MRKSLAEFATVAMRFESLGDALVNATIDLGSELEERNDLWVWFEAKKLIDFAVESRLFSVRSPQIVALYAARKRFAGTLDTGLLGAIRRSREPLDPDTSPVPAWIVDAQSPDGKRHRRFFISRSVAEGAMQDLLRADPDLIVGDAFRKDVRVVRLFETDDLERFLRAELPGDSQ